MIFAAKEAVERRARRKGRQEGREEGRQEALREERERIERELAALEKSGVQVFRRKLHVSSPASPVRAPDLSPGTPLARASDSLYNVDTGYQPANEKERP